MWQEIFVLTACASCPWTSPCWPGPAGQSPLRPPPVAWPCLCVFVLLTSRREHRRERAGERGGGRETPKYVRPQLIAGCARNSGNEAAAKEDEDDAITLGKKQQNIQRKHTQNEDQEFTEPLLFFFFFFVFVLLLFVCCYVTFRILNIYNFCVCFNIIIRCALCFTTVFSWHCQKRIWKLKCSCKTYMYVYMYVFVLLKSINSLCQLEGSRIVNEIPPKSQHEYNTRHTRGRRK